MKLGLLTAALVAVAATIQVLGQSGSGKGKTAVDRGREAVHGRPALNSPLWSLDVFDNAWKQWGLKEKPADYARAFRDRYGLHEAPYENDGLPMGLHVTRGLFGKGIINDCLLCHAGRVAGQTIIGLGNANLDLQGLFEELSAQQRLPKFPFEASYVRGTIDPLGGVAFLMELRDPDLNLQRPVKLDYVENVC